MKVMYPGSFDPITVGHIDLIERCSEKFDEVVVAIMVNDVKNYTFTTDERKQMIEESISHLDNVEVVIGTGLTVHFAESIGCNVLVRGIRAVMDYEAELQQATANRALNKNVETLFLVSNPVYSFISSSLAKTIASYGGDLSFVVPKHVKKELTRVYGKGE